MLFKSAHTPTHTPVHFDSVFHQRHAYLNHKETWVTFPCIALYKPTVLSDLQPPPVTKRYTIWTCVFLGQSWLRFLNQEIKVLKKHMYRYIYMYINCNFFCFVFHFMCKNCSLFFVSFKYLFMVFHFVLKPINVSLVPRHCCVHIQFIIY